MSGRSWACILALTSFILGSLSFVLAIWTNITQERRFLLLTVICFVLALVLGILARIALNRSGEASQKTRIPVGIILAILALIPVFVGSAESVRWVTVRVSGINNLKVIGQAFQAYQRDQGCLPPAALRGREDRPLLSWRVLLLPYLDQKELYDQFHKDEPWDSAHNKPLLKNMPRIYAPGPGNPTGAPNTTYYQVFVGKGAIFDGKRRTLEQIEAADGCANTLLVVEANSSVLWTKPEDLAQVQNQPLPPLGDFYRKECFVNPRGRFLALFADGSVRSFFHDTPEPLLRPLATWNGGEEISWAELAPWSDKMRGEATWRQPSP